MHSHFVAIIGISCIVGLYSVQAASEPANTEVTGKVLSVSSGKAILHLTEGRHPASGFKEQSEFVLGKGDSLIVSPGDTVRGQAVPFGGGYRPGANLAGGSRCGEHYGRCESPAPP